MGPKKKQEEIDLSTLPQCKSINIFLFSKGKKSRATQIVSKIETNCQQFMFHVTKAAVLDHAKEKGIYVDPQSLTDKQKKDPKFMETVCTEMTPEVLGKAVESYINNQNVKIRLEKKANAEKPQEQQQKNANKFDCIYVFDDFPLEVSQFQGLAMRYQNISFIIVLDQKISWASAPEEPSPQEQDPEQPDEEIIQFRRLKQQQILKEEDIEQNKIIDNKVRSIKLERKKSSRDSLFRNTVIDDLSLIINPYNEQESISEGASKFVERLNQLIIEQDDFLQWKKDKKAVQFYEEKVEEKEPEKAPEEEVQQGEEVKKEEQKETKPIVQYKAKGCNTIDILNNAIEDLCLQEVAKRQEDGNYWDIDNFDFAAPAEQKELGKLRNRNQSQEQRQPYFIHANECVFDHERKLYSELLQNLKFPGINRFSIPEVPPKSEKLRKMERSTFGQFLPAGLTFHDFQRKLDILSFESCAKQNDQQRQYNFGDRVYVQEHDMNSLIRQINSAFLFDESAITLKYNQNNDKLYMALLYKNGPRRFSKKYWQNSWKVLPNFESWLKYFKENETNMQNPLFYDIDYELIGNIQEDCSVYSTKEGGAIIHKKQIAANEQNFLLYCLFSGKQNEIFGVRPNQFYCENSNIKILHSKNGSTYLTFQDSTIIKLSQNGHVFIQKPNHPQRIMTNDGYMIIYHQNKPEILHPNGGISHPPEQFTNRKGHGLTNDRLKDVPALKRSLPDCSMIKRDDNTVIVNRGEDEEWIRFPDETQYFSRNKQLLVEKEEFPLLKINKSEGTVEVSYLGIKANLVKAASQTYNFKIQLDYGFSINLEGSSVKVANGQNYYNCNLLESCISQEWQGQSLKVYFNGKSQYRRGDKILDPTEDEENYSEQDILPKDYIHPRLFIINNDNTGCQLFNRNQLQNNFFINFVEDKQSLNELYKKNIDKKQTYHGIISVPSKEELTKKVIRPGFNINLDVFKYQDVEDSNKKTEVFKIRSFIKNEEFTEEQRSTIKQIIQKQVEWAKKSLRENNEYGSKPRNDPATEQKFQQNKTVIEYRLLKEVPNKYNDLTSQAIASSQDLKREKKAEELRREKDEELKKRMSKKKTYQSSYPPIYLKQKVRDANEIYYSNEGFYPTYWETVEGKKTLSEMPDWVFRPKQINKPRELDPEIVEELNNTMNRTKKTYDDPVIDEREEKNQRYDTVEVDIEPQQIYIKPSVFTQREIDEQRFAFEQEKKAYEYHEVKRKDFDVYGNERKQKNEVPSLMRTQPVSELNQKYLVTEAPVDKKVKISSMKNKLTSLASNMTQMRKQGPHNNLIRTLDKRNDYSKLLEKRTMMVQADLNDRLQRDILINPTQANFGFIKEGLSYELKITIKNEDVLSQRIVLKKPKSIFCKVQMREMGPIAMGMTRQISVIFKASPEISGKFTDEFDINTKHEIYHIPITAHICSATQFENGRHLLAKGVREFKEESRMRKTGELPPIN